MSILVSCRVECINQELWPLALAWPTVLVNNSKVCLSNYCCLAAEKWNKHWLFAQTWTLKCFFFFFYCQEDTQWHWWTMIYTCYFTRWSTLQLSQEYTKLAMLSKTFQTTLCNNVSALLHVFEKQLVLALFWKFKDVWLCKNTYVTFWQQIVKSRSSEHTWK